MPIPEDRQQIAISDAAQTITQTRQQVQRAAHTIRQVQATLGGLPAQYKPIIDAAEGADAQEWTDLGKEFGAVKSVVDAAIARAEVQALANVAPGA